LKNSREYQLEEAPDTPRVVDKKEKQADKTGCNQQDWIRGDECSVIRLSIARLPCFGDSRSWHCDGGGQLYSRRTTCALPVAAITWLPSSFCHPQRGNVVVLTQAPQTAEAAQILDTHFFSKANAVLDRVTVANPLSGHGAGAADRRFSVALVS
jgi:hypothetical protein